MLNPQRRVEHLRQDRVEGREHAALDAAHADILRVELLGDALRVVPDEVRRSAIHGLAVAVGQGEALGAHARDRARLWVHRIRRLIHEYQFGRTVRLEERPDLGP